MATDTTLQNLIQLEEQEQNFDPQGLIHCRLCDSPITHQIQRTQVGGAHQHRFTNPSDIQFHLACFQQAPGCAISGQPTPVYSWFQGYQWQYALCGECQEHVGWYYEDHNRNSFFGLILARLQFSA